MAKQQASALIDVATFRARAKGGAPVRDAHVVRMGLGQPKALDDGSRTIRFCFSDGSVDRMGDTIDPKGWRLNTFNANPVALWAHDSSAPPIGRASQVVVEDERLMGTIEFATAEIYPFADTVYRLTKGGFLNAVSVGFIPLEYSFSDEDGREWGLDFEVQELLEISVCPVPANANALVEARRKGIDTRPLVEWAERALEGGGRAVVSKAELDRLRKAAKEVPLIRRRTAVRTRGEGLEETDPAAGGAGVATSVATCARAADDECGMANPEECAVHRANNEDEAKRLAALVRRAVREALGKSATRRRLAPKPRSRADGEEGGGDDAPEGMRQEHQDAIREASEHLEAMGDALDEAADHHEAAMDLVGSVCDDLDETEERDVDPEEADAEERAAARRARRAKRLAARHGAA